MQKKISIAVLLISVQLLLGGCRLSLSDIFKPSLEDSYKKRQAYCGKQAHIEAINSCLAYAEVDYKCATKYPNNSNAADECVKVEQNALTQKQLAKQHEDIYMQDKADCYKKSYVKVCLEVLEVSRNCELQFPNDGNAQQNCRNVGNRQLIENSWGVN